MQGARRRGGVNQVTAIEEILTSAKVIAIVGLSERKDRPSYGVAEYLQAVGYRVIPINPVLRQPVLGEQPYADLESFPGHIDLVDIFRRSDLVGEVVDSAISVGADAIWMQLGIVNEQAATTAEQAGLKVVMDRCTAVEHRKLVMSR